MYSVSGHLCLQSSVLGVNTSGGQKDGSQRVVNWDCKDGEREQTIPLLSLPSLCAERHEVCCHHAQGGLDSSPFLVKTH
jgi:hypothetical protein